MTDPTLSLLTPMLEAPLRPERWEDFVDALVERHGAILGVCTCVDPGHETRAYGFRSRVIRENEAELAPRYLRGEDADDAEGARRLHTIASERMLTEREIFDAPSVEALPPSRWRDFLRESFGVHHRAGLPLDRWSARMDVLWLHFADARNPEAPEVRDELDALQPLVGRTLRLHRVFEALRARFRAALGAMDRLGLGAMLLVAGGEAILANETAEAILAADDGLARDAAGRLIAADSDFAATLPAALAETIAAARLKRRAAGRAFPVTRCSGRAPYLMSLAPLIDSAGEVEPGLRGAMAFVIDPAGETPLSMEGLRLAGGLTAAETEVCRLIVEGLDGPAIAERRGTSPDTVKKQAKSAAAKLGCGSRAELALHTRLPIRE